jgi:hypothetical protein
MVAIFSYVSPDSLSQQQIEVLSSSAAADHLLGRFAVTMDAIIA